MMPWLTASPRPLPSPSERVVKNGSKTRLMMSSGIPSPSSWIQQQA